MELKMIKMFPGLSNNLVMNELALFKTHSSYEDMVSNNYSQSSIFINLLVQYARVSTTKCHDENAGRILDSVFPYIDEAIVCDDALERLKRVYLIIIRLYPIYAKEFKEPQKRSIENNPGSSHERSRGTPQGNGQTGNSNASSGNQSKDSGPSNSSSDSQSKENGSSNSSSGQNNSSGEAKKSKSESKKKGGASKGSKDSSANSSKNSSDGNPADNELQKIIEDIKEAAKKVEDGNEVSESSRISEKSLTAGDLSSMMKKIEKESEVETAEEKIVEELNKIKKDGEFLGRIKVNRNASANTTNYNLIEAEVKKTSNRLAKIFTVHDEAVVENGLLLGSRLDVNSLYRKDHRVFEKKTEPREFDMAVAVLVDTSGSMRGTRLNKAVMAASVLYDFCSKKNIPICVYGHSEESEVETLTAAAEFGSKDGKDKYRIASLVANGRNRDVDAIKFVAERISSRPEQRKILIVISDGKPNGLNHYGETAKEQIKKEVRKLSKKGVSLIAAAIGDDKDLIKSIYNKAFLNISDLSAMPKKFLDLIMNY